MIKNCANIQSEKIDILGIPIDNYSMQEFNDIIQRIIVSDLKCMILAINIYSANLAFKFNWFLQLYKNACFVHCDGDGIRIAAKILGKSIKEKITFNKWIWELARISEKKNLSWFLIGSSNETIIKAVAILKNKYPRLNILGYRDGFFENQESINTTINEINFKAPNILILGMGQPLQEEWLMKYNDKIKYNVALGGGAVFEYVSGNTRITPNFYVKYKLEWFYRFLHDPKRLFLRYFFGIPIFYFRVLAEKFSVIKDK
jgi:N-acetylglucosaminyldiphosphoundecaprenol N-acetyl-beta-D-mannosaminyltransferase